MTGKQDSVEAVLKEILAAIDMVRTVAQSEQDKARNHAADWLDEQFSGVTDGQALCEASAEGLRLYRGGTGSFQDVGTAASADAVARLHSALKRGRTPFPA